MRFAASTLALLAAVGLAAAQTPAGALVPRATSACNAQNIVDACRTGIETEIDKCKANDWICLCDNYTNLLTCYNNCPDSLDRSPVQNQVTSYCLAAEPLKSASAADAATRPVPSVAATSAPATTGTDAANTATGTQTAGQAFNTGAAGHVAAPVGGVVAVLLGLAGLL
ncbi:hypothetical protein K505DRAFT_324850 [Melanomma pulvis-pyrius CBS 109.77]|uniref:GPI anchored serine-threonine rich protein n=1 Tax=Melanomma pulvis-pyrius CBS 109.77 TaxID=1314802 RepID=A0A6A6XD22_9PLEO|nr:hypothetical protein K505DRAFT_324850 [Melanomma pulvis-pyrius CBS 109.77]